MSVDPKQKTEYEDLPGQLALFGEKAEDALAEDLFARKSPRAARTKKKDEPEDMPEQLELFLRRKGEAAAEAPVKEQPEAANVSAPAAEAPEQEQPETVNVSAPAAEAPEQEQPEYREERRTAFSARLRSAGKTAQEAFAPVPAVETPEQEQPKAASVSAPAVETPVKEQPEAAEIIPAPAPAYMPVEEQPGVSAKSSGAVAARRRSAEKAAEITSSAADASEKERAEKASAPGPVARFRTELKKEWAVFRSAASRFLAAVAAFFAGWAKNFRRGSASFRAAVHAKKEKGFPESSHFPVQLFFFLWGMIPYRLSKLREKFHFRRRRSIHRSSRRSNVFERIHLRLRPAVFLAAAGVLACVAIFFSLFSSGTHVQYGDADLGYVSNIRVVRKACENISAITANVLEDSHYSLSESEFKTNGVLVSRQKIQTEQEFETALSAELGLVQYGYGLYINDELICSVAYPHVLEDMLQQMQYAYTTKKTVSCDFEEDVAVRDGYYPADSRMELDEIAELLNSTHQQEVTYKVKSGDVWVNIAKKNNMSSKALKQLNPGYEIDKLHVGDELVLSAAVPYLTVTFTEQQHTLEDVPYKVEDKEDSSMYKGDYKVLTKGEYGKADVLAEVTYKNGEEISRTVTASVTVKEPVTEVRAVGTKARPTWHPTGSFRWPCTGRISSYYGGRRIFGRYNNHGGIDIANKRGTPIYAADGGTVKHAGWYSTYGYLVIIDHGNGYETYYGHNSKILVSVGQHVYKGQQIAKMGMTGRATGNHCHFEVRYHGSRRNPLKYLP